MDNGLLFLSVCIYTVSTSFPLLVLPPDARPSTRAPNDWLSRREAISRCQVPSGKCIVHHGLTSACCMVCLVPQSQVSGSFENPHFNMFTLQLDRPTCVRNRLSAFQVSQGVLCASWEVFVSTDVKVYTAVQGHELFSTQLHASSFRRRVDVLSAFDKALPRFQAWHHSEVSIEWVPLVRSLLCPLRTTFHRSHYVWWRDSDEYG